VQRVGNGGIPLLGGIWIFFLVKVSQPMRFWALVPIVPVIYLFLFLIEGRNYNDFCFNKRELPIWL
jgi:hypothetical protein